MPGIRCCSSSNNQTKITTGRADAQGNPHIHGMLAYGYVIIRTALRSLSHELGQRRRICTNEYHGWEADLPVRGVIGYHPRQREYYPLPRQCDDCMAWPAAQLYDAVNDTNTALDHVIEKATSPIQRAARFRGYHRPVGRSQIVVTPRPSLESIG